MSSDSDPVEIAVLDNYQGVALEMADRSALNGRARITVFRDHLADDRALVERLRPFDVVCGRVAPGAAHHLYHSAQHVLTLAYRFRT
jgi:hypothetical protein